MDSSENHDPTDPEGGYAPPASMTDKQKRGEGDVSMVLREEDYNFMLMDNDTITDTTIASSKQTQDHIGSPLSLGTAMREENVVSGLGEQKLLSPMDESPSGKKRKRAIDSFEMSESDFAASDTITSRLKELYIKKLLPVERKWGLHSFCLPNEGEIDAAEFDARPLVLVLGQYSTGKTTFIRHLIGRDFPGMHIGPEPTTDRFMVLLQQKQENQQQHIHEYESSDTNDDAEGNIFTKMCTHSEKDGMSRAATGTIIKGNTLTVLPELPFSSLSTFGSAFLNHLEGSVSSAPLLKHVTIIDTPGILSGEKQYLRRTYDYAKVAKWFADRADLIILIFDAHKLDVSDEFQDVVDAIRKNNDDKIRCVLNKADGVSKEQLVRVYGSLMWSMGKMFSTPEVMRVYTGSFWDEPLNHDEFEEMFESDEWRLTHELVNLPRTSAERKLNQMVKRTRTVKVHLCILDYLRKKVPLFGKKRAQEALIENLDRVFDECATEYKLSRGDMPDVKEFTACLRQCEDFYKFPSVDRRTLSKLDDMIKVEIPNMINAVGGLTGKKGPPAIGAKRTRKALVKVANKIKAGRLLGPASGRKASVKGEIAKQNRMFSNTPIFTAVLALLIFLSIGIKLRWFVPDAELIGGSSFLSFFELFFLA